VLTAESRNLQATLASLDRADYERAVHRLAETPGRVLVAAGECVHGGGELLATWTCCARASGCWKETTSGSGAPSRTCPAAPGAFSDAAAGGFWHLRPESVKPSSIPSSHA